jgi:hypothetical protein
MTVSTRGRIAYLDLQRKETGNEYFSVTRYADGCRTVRCECHFNDIGLVRDVTLNLDPDWRPNDAYLRVNHGGKTLGAGWFRFGNGEVHCDAIDGTGKHQHFSRPYAGGKPAFGAHPIINDGLWTALFDMRYPHKVQRLADCITYSKEVVGRSLLPLTLLISISDSRAWKLWRCRPELLSAAVSKCS